jgi:DNA-binding CsgD family transcriptional regulator
MELLKSRDLAAVSGALERLYHPGSIARFPLHLLEIVDGFLPGTVITFDTLELATQRVTNHLNREENPGWVAQLSAFIDQNPIVPYIKRGGTEPVLKVTDFISHRQFRKTDFYHGVMVPMSVKYQIAVPVALPGHAAGLTVNRDKDFSEGDRLILRILAPHIAQAHTLSRLFHDLKALSGTVKETDFLQLRGIGLTTRECEIAYWMSEGKRDREIAMIVRSSHRTINHQVASILAKLQVETRTTAVKRILELLRGC